MRIYLYIYNLIDINRHLCILKSILYICFLSSDILYIHIIIDFSSDSSICTHAQY